MRQQSSPRNAASSLHRALAAVLAAAALALAAAPATPAVAASNQVHLDSQVLKAMQLGQKVHVIVVARTDATVLEAELRRSGVKQTVRVPIAHGIAVELTASLVKRFSTDPDVARIVYDAPVRLNDTPFNPSALALSLIHI